jgi:pimeloyl-ACP methyl ester carboxylesterase
MRDKGQDKVGHDMTTFVLVHGAWGGGWEWRRVARGLQALGHEAFTPTLTGLGERSHLLTRDVGLVTHVGDIVNVLLFEDLHDVVLCGHSSSGTVVACVAEAAANRLANVVYIDAPIPRDGESLLDLLPSDFVTRTRASAETEGGGWRVPVPFDDGDELGMPEEIASWYLPRLVDHPLRAMEEAVSLRNEATVQRTFVRCTEHALADIIGPHAERAKTEGWTYYELATGHDPQILDADGLVTVLDDATRPAESGNRAGSMGAP